MWTKMLPALPLTVLVSLSATAQEIDAEAARDAGESYRNAVRIAVRAPVDTPKGTTASWRGSVSADDPIDTFKLSPLPPKGHAILLAANSDNGNIQVTLRDRKTGEIVATAERIEGNENYGLILVPEVGVTVSVSFVEGDMQVPYHLGIIYSSPDAVGIPSQDMATKAFAEAMKRKPKFKPLPEGFSLVVAPEGVAPSDDDEDGS